MIAPLSKSIITVGSKWLSEPADLRRPILTAFPQRKYKPIEHQHAVWRLQAVPPEVPSVGASGWQLIDRRDWEQDDPAFAAKQASRLPAVRPSEKAVSIDTPQEVVQHCLVCLRKADIDGFAEHLSDDALRRPQSVHWIAGFKAAEGGPLLQCAGVLSPGARRVLPGHLLRRSHVMSSLALGLSHFQLRSAVTASTGEEAVLLWQLHKLGGRWLVQSVARDRSADEPLPSVPHPRSSPDAVVAAQLSALASGNTWTVRSPPLPDHQASAFSARQAECSPAERQLAEQALERVLSQPSHRALHHHVQAVLGPSALPSQSKFLQEVTVYPAGSIPPTRVVHNSRDVDAASRSVDAAASVDESASEGGKRFLWFLQLRDDHCWIVADVVPAAVH